VSERQQLSILRQVTAEDQDGHAEHPARKQVHDLEQHPPSQPSACLACLRKRGQPLNRVVERYNVRYVTEGQQAGMPKTDAERQQAWRDRRARLIDTLKQENARLRDALTEAERLTMQACKHPAAAVDGGTCHACGTDVW
jgi:hypothetical protein